MIKKFFILFILIFVFSSSFAFAGTMSEMTTEMSEYILNYYSNVEHLVISKNTANITDENKTNIKNLLNNTSASSFANAFNSLFVEAIIQNKIAGGINLNIDFKNITCYGFMDTKNNLFYFDFIISNNTYPNNNNLGYQEFNTYTTSTYCNVYAYSNPVYHYTIKLSENNTFNYDKEMIQDITAYSYRFFPHYNPTFNQDETIIYLPFQLALSDYQECYYNDKAYIIGNRIQTEITPPSGDTGESGDTGGGTTTSSGDTGTTTPNYNEKLDNIQSGINNIENKIPTSGDITQSTTTGVIQGNTSYWGSSGDLTGKEQEETIEQGINDVIDTVSGDFAKNEIFQMLDHYNSQMWGIFTGETDFKIEWSAVNYKNTELIPAGNINFTQICKDIEILGYIKSLINIIISFHVILALVEQIYNLILSTLGIDNPYLYEDGNYTEITNVQTGERTEKLYRNRRVYKK